VPLSWSGKYGEEKYLDWNPDTYSTHSLATLPTELSLETKKCSITEIFNKLFKHEYVIKYT
jgi:hypothetical protein